MFISPAYAQAAGGAPTDFFFGGGLIPLLLIFLIFYFLIIRPQNQRLKRHREMVMAVKRGDTVVTGGGLIGKVARVQDDEVTVEIADGVKVRALKSTLSDVRVKGSGGDQGKDKGKDKDKDA